MNTLGTEMYAMDNFDFQFAKSTLLKNILNNILISER